MKLQQEEQQQKPNKSTKKYDKVTKKIKKLLGATAQTFIPELCEALKQDWYPYLTEEQIRNDKKIRDSIRDKILEDWSNESMYHSEDSIWSNGVILRWVPKWLKNPSEKLTMETARDAKIKSKSQISEREKQKLEQIVEELPDSVIVQEEEPVPDEEFYGTLQELGVAPYGETGKSTRALTGDISEHAYKLFAALTNMSSPPNTSDNLLVDYIRPSREFRRGLMLEVDSHRRTAIHNALHYASVAIEDMIQIISEIDKQEEEK